MKKAEQDQQFLEALMAKKKQADDELHEELLTEDDKKELQRISKGYETLGTIVVPPTVKEILACNEYWEEHYVMPEDWESDPNG